METFNNYIQIYIPIVVRFHTNRGKVSNLTRDSRKVRINRSSLNLQYSVCVSAKISEFA